MKNLLIAFLLVSGAGAAFGQTRQELIQKYGRPAEIQQYCAEADAALKLAQKMEAEHPWHNGIQINHKFFPKLVELRKELAWLKHASKIKEEELTRVQNLVSEYEEVNAFYMTLPQDVQDTLHQKRRMTENRFFAAKLAAEKCNKYQN